MVGPRPGHTWRRQASLVAGRPDRLRGRARLPLRGWRGRTDWGPRGALWGSLWRPRRRAPGNQGTPVPALRGAGQVRVSSSTARSRCASWTGTSTTARSRCASTASWASTGRGPRWAAGGRALEPLARRPAAGPRRRARFLRQQLRVLCKPHG